MIVIVSLQGPKKYCFLDYKIIEKYNTFDNFITINITYGYWRRKLWTGPTRSRIDGKKAGMSEPQRLEYIKKIVTFTFCILYIHRRAENIDQYIDRKILEYVMSLSRWTEYSRKQSKNSDALVKRCGYQCQSLFLYLRYKKKLEIPPHEIVRKPLQFLKGMRKLTGDEKHSERHSISPSAGDKDKNSFWPFVSMVSCLFYKNWKNRGKWHGGYALKR